MEYPEAVVANLSEEHGVVDLSACAERPKVGDVVHVVPNHCCVVSNMVDELYGVRGGAVEVVWPVAARGPGALTRPDSAAAPVRCPRRAAACSRSAARSGGPA
jgi:hypothetical protein